MARNPSLPLDDDDDLPSSLALDDDRRVTARVAAAFTGFSPAGLERRRRLGLPPHPVEVGKNMCWYRLGDLRRFNRGQQCDGGEPPAAA